MTFRCPMSARWRPLLRAENSFGCEIGARRLAVVLDTVGVDLGRYHDQPSRIDLPAERLTHRIRARLGKLLEVRVGDLGVRDHQFFHLVGWQRLVKAEEIARLIELRRLVGVLQVLVVLVRRDLNARQVDIGRFFIRVEQFLFRNTLSDQRLGQALAIELRIDASADVELQRGPRLQRLCDRVQLALRSRGYGCPAG